VERHTVLGKIFRGLPRIPLELQFALPESYAIS
jgi:hypothetical protein